MTADLAGESRSLVFRRLSAWFIPALVVTALAVLVGHLFQQRQFWPIVLAPLLLGGAAGVGYAVLARVARLHYPWISVVAAAAMATAGDVALFRLAYHQYEHDLAASVAKTRRSGRAADGLALLGAAPDARTPAGSDLVDRYLQIQTGRGGLVGFFLWRSQQGLRFGAWTVRGPWMIALWIVEWLAWAGGSAAVVGWAASQPFCEHCQSWYDRQGRGRLRPEQTPVLRGLLSLSSGPAEQEGLDYELLTCHEGCSPPLLIVEQPSRRGFLPERRRLRYRGFLSPTERDAVRDLIKGDA